MEIQLQNISVTLNNKKVLNKINFTVNDGQLISLLGKSGCGKTTLLNTIAGIITACDGTILLDGKIANDIPVHKRKTVIVFQDFRLFPHLTVGENINFPLKMRGISKKEAQKEVSKLLKMVQLEGFENRSVEQISGGQMQRVALARALAADPVLLLLDEPFSSLDSNLRKEMRELVLEIQRKLKLTTILVTHDKEEALTMSDYIAFMDDGKIIQYDTPEDIYNYPHNELVADYFLEGKYVHGIVNDNYFSSDLINVDLTRSNGNYRCLIKPSAVKISNSEGHTFEIIAKLYQGESYLLELQHLKSGIVVDCIVEENTKYEVGNTVDVDIITNKLVFIHVN